MEAVINSDKIGEKDEFVIKRFINRPVSSNCYVIYPPKGNKCLIIDPGSKDVYEINNFLTITKLSVDYIILTHHHFDHIWGVDKLIELYETKVISSTICAQKVKDRKHNLSSFYEDSGFIISSPEILVEEINFKLDWQNTTFEFYDTKGHSDGCISILMGEKLFTGDALIKDVDILTKLPGGSKNNLKATYDLYHQLLKAKQELMIYPGHGEVFKLNTEDLALKKIVIKDKIWLSSPHMGGGEQKYVQEAFDTNWVAPLGPNVTGFENDLAAYLKADIHVAALSSGTAALHLALILLGVGPGDEVICQSMTFSASANPIAYLGAIPVFVDSEKETWNMCPQFLEKAIVDRIAKGKKPKAILPVHLYGMPAKMDEILAIAAKYDIPVLEDAAEALGSHIDHKNCGTFGEMACLSFNGNKIITTSGGGALVAKQRKNVDQAIFLATQARDQAPHYQHSHIGYNYRMSNIVAGIGRGQMEVLDKHIQNRRANFECYQKAFADIPQITMLAEPLGFFSNRWLSCITVTPTNAITRETIRLALDAENIESRPLWKPMHLQPIFATSPFYGDGTAEELFNNGLCLPSGSNLTYNDLDRVIANIVRNVGS